MEIRWEHLTPPEFKKLAREEKLCVLPLGSLERHGEHMPYGSDALVAHEVACLAAKREPCVVFPPYWFGQVHEAAGFTGTINFPMDFLLKMLEILLDQIAQNGFKKILILVGHGGNKHFVEYFSMAQMDRKVDYTLYSMFIVDGPRYNALDIWEAPGGGHADEGETSYTMAVLPDSVKLHQQCFCEPIDSKEDLAHLREKRIHSGLWWYGMYPENVSGNPSKATMEKGKIALEALAADFAEVIRTVKADTVAPRLQQEYYDRVSRVKDCE